FGRLERKNLAREVSIEEEVEVLIGGDSPHDVEPDLVVEQLAGVAVRDAGGELLKRGVDQAVQERVELGTLAARDLLHPAALEGNGVDGSRHQEVVADHDRVTALFGGPLTDPALPVLTGLHATQGAEVVREVVLRQEVDEQGATRDLAEVG